MSEKSKNFRSLESVLGRVMSGLGLDARLREHAMVDIWPLICGEPWSRKTRALYLDRDGNLVVSVADASTGQELSLLKPQLIKQLNTAAKSLGLSVKGIRLDLKQYHEKPPVELHLVGAPPKLPEPTDADIAAVELSVEQREEVQTLLEELRHREDQGETSPISAKRIAALFEKELKVRQWRREHGYPVCGACGVPTNMLREPEGICSVCYYSQS